jgi:hypothetical protein
MSEKCLVALTSATHGQIRRTSIAELWHGNASRRSPSAAPTLLTPPDTPRNFYKKSRRQIRVFLKLWSSAGRKWKTPQSLGPSGAGSKGPEGSSVPFCARPASQLRRFSGGRLRQRHDSSVPILLKICEKLRIRRDPRANHRPFLGPRPPSRPVSGTSGFPHAESVAVSEASNESDCRTR